MIIQSTKFSAIFAGLAILAFASYVSACNIPVFRYALERWKSDPYELVVLHDSELSNEESAFLATWKPSPASSPTASNIEVRRIRPDEPEFNTLLRRVGDDKAIAKSSLPHVILRTQIRGQDVIVWDGPLTDVMSAHLLNSPARIELAKRLTDGDSVVWIIIGDVKKLKVAATQALLQKCFTQHATKIRLPEGVGLPGSELFSEIPLLLKSSIIEIDCDDPDEVMLIELANRLQPTAFDAGESLVLPVFGRGRALEVIPASALDERMVEDLMVFLSGACSCQVKERNPGFDLLMSTNWESRIFGEDGERPPATSVTEPSTAPRMLTIPPGRRTSQE